MHNGMHLQATTVNDLPVELLISVFTYAGHPESCDRPLCAKLKGRHWTHLMLVCRRWWAVILGAKFLWTSIDFADNFNWVEICLVRSRPAAIDVRLVGLCASTLRRALPLIVADGSRIRSLTFQSYLQTISTSLLQLLFQSPMPALENLTVSLTRQADGWLDADFGLSAMQDLRLRSLDLAGFPLPLNTEVYSQMTSLALHQGSTSREGFTFDHLLHILRTAAPHLRELDLSQLRLPPLLVGQTDQAAQPRTPLLQLPKVWSYYMDNDYATASRVLRALQLSACTHFHLRVRVQPSADRPTFQSTLLQLIPQNIRPILGSPTELAITMTANTYTLRDPGPRGERSVHRGNPWHTDRVQVSIVGGRIPELSDIVHLASLAHLTSLTLSLDQECEVFAYTLQWQSLLSASPCLTTLHVDSHSHPTGLVHALTPVSTAHPVLCPVLRVFSVSMSFTNLGESGVLACLRERVGRASKLSSLTLKGCVDAEHTSTGRKTMRALRSLVGELILVV